MNILIDTPITRLFEPSAADLDNSTSRRYLVATDPQKLAITVIQEELANEVDGELERLTGKTIDYSAGHHHYNRIGYCLPENEGLLHSKLSMRKIVTDPHDITLSLWLQCAIDREESAHRSEMSGEQIVIYVPPQLATRLRQIALVAGKSLNALINDELIGFAQDNQ